MALDAKEVRVRGCGFTHTVAADSPFTDTNAWPDCAGVYACVYACACAPARALESCSWAAGAVSGASSYRFNGLELERYTGRLSCAADRPF